MNRAASLETVLQLAEMLVLNSLRWHLLLFSIPLACLLACYAQFLLLLGY